MSWLSSLVSVVAPVLAPIGEATNDPGLTAVGTSLQGGGGSPPVTGDNTNYAGGIEKYISQEADALNKAVSAEVVSLSIYICIFVVALVCLWALLAPSPQQVASTTESVSRTAEHVAPLLAG